MPWFWWLIMGLTLLLLSSAIAGWSFAPWVPIWSKDLPRVFALARLKPGEIFYDLGCGNGKTVFYAAEQYAAKAIGIELSFPLWLTCRLRQIVRRTPRVTFKLGNLFRQDLSSVDVIYVFGMPEKLQHKLRAKLERELKPGSRVVSYTFPIAGWQSTKVDKPSPKDISIYLYQR